MPDVGFDSRAFDYLIRAHDRFLSVHNTAAAQEVAAVMLKLSGGCTPTAHVWPISGPWCYCRREEWRGPGTRKRRKA